MGRGWRLWVRTHTELWPVKLVGEGEAEATLFRVEAAWKPSYFWNDIHTEKEGKMGIFV